jgi:hypothetical protein
MLPFVLHPLDELFEPILAADLLEKWVDPPPLSVPPVK